MSWLTDTLKLLPTVAQGASLTRAGIQGVGGSMVAAGLPTGNWPLAGAGTVLWLGAAAWGLFVHTPAQQIVAVAKMTGPEKTIAFTKIPDEVKLEAVEAIPEVKAILVRAPIARDGVADAVADPGRPKVQAA